MITDLTVIDQRHKAVLEVLEHCAKITDVAVRYGVDRQPSIAGSPDTRKKAWERWRTAAQSPIGAPTRSLLRSRIASWSSAGSIPIAEPAPFATCSERNSMKCPRSHRCTAACSATI